MAEKHAFQEIRQHGLVGYRANGIVQMPLKCRSTIAIAAKHIRNCFSTQLAVGR